MTLVVRLPGGGVGRERCLRLRGRRRGRLGRRTVFVPAVVGRRSGHDGHRALVTTVVAAGGRPRRDALRGAPVVVAPPAGGGTGPRARAGTAAGLAPAGLTPAGLTPARLPVAALAPPLGLAGLPRVGARFGRRPRTGGASAGLGALLGP